jgi:ribose 5-phosphate isomerase B
MIAVGSDCGGFLLKKEIIAYLEKNGYQYKDFGTFEESGSVDYPDFGQAVAEAVKNGLCEKGILVCGTGIGMAIAANKVPGIRAANCTDCFSARMSREHNNANILTLGERVTGKGLALEIVDTWLKAEFTGGRHQCRVDKISAIEAKYLKG